MRRRVALTLAAALAAAGCGARDGSEESASDAARRALQLFRLAAEGEPEGADLDDLFGAADDEASRAALLDALAAVGGGDAPRILAERPLEQVERVAVDLERDLPGGGRAVFSVQVAVSLDPPRIVWFSGPGIEWPTRVVRGDGLSVSAPPPDDPGG